MSLVLLLTRAAQTSQVQTIKVPRGDYAHAATKERKEILVGRLKTAGTGPLQATRWIYLFILAIIMSRPISAFFLPPASTPSSKTKSSESPKSQKSPKRQRLEASSSDPPPLPSSSSSSSSTVAGDGGWRSAFDAMEPSWKTRLATEMKKPYVDRLITFLDGESRTHTVFPPKAQVWTALNLCPFEQVKVVVLGQDPYHGPNQAHGLAFSVAKGIAIPPSLRNMITEASRDPEVAIPPTAPHGNLECWSRQGVLMLNTCLTVRKGEANSHQKKGWEDFTDAIIRELSKREGIVYMLWGAPAQSKCKSIDAKKNVIIKTSHPSPLAAYKTAEAFMTSRCFSRCNTALKELGQEPIDWRIV